MPDWREPTEEQKAIRSRAESHKTPVPSSTRSPDIPLEPRLANPAGIQRPSQPGWLALVCVALTAAVLSVTATVLILLPSRIPDQSEAILRLTVDLQNTKRDLKETESSLGATKKKLATLDEQLDRINGRLASLDGQPSTSSLAQSIEDLKARVKKLECAGRKSCK